MSEITCANCEKQIPANCICTDYNFVGMCYPCVVERLEAESERLQARVDALEGLVMQVVGWCYAEACIQLEDGVDMRQVAVPDLIAKLEKDIPEVAALKGDKPDE